VRWHRAGFRYYWRWKSRPLGGRPQIETDLRALIRRMSIENPLWGAPRIHGEPLKLGFEVAQSSVAKYMVRRRRLPSQGWFLRNHAPDIAALDLFIAPIIGFDLSFPKITSDLDPSAYSTSTPGAHAEYSQPHAADDTCVRAAAESSRIIAAPFSPIMMVAALVLPETIPGMIEASTTRNPASSRTRRR
jgi:hypothetical protein